MGSEKQNRLNCLISFLASLILFALLSGRIELWETGGKLISPSFSRSAIPLSFFLILSLLAHIRIFGFKALKDLTACPTGFSYGLVFYFLSDFCCRGFNLYQGPSIRAELIAVWTLLILSWRYISTEFLKYFLLSSCLLLITIFFYLSSGQPIISDDHASFIFRLSLLKQYFPNIPLYYPGWNAGLDARDFFATGALGYFLLTAPVHYLLETGLSHNISLVLLLFAVLPFSLGYACRLAGLQKTTSLIAAIISVASSLVWYRWALKYGTVGFVTSTCLMPVVFVLGYKLLNSEKLTRFEMCLFILLGSVSIMWPLGVVCYLALIIMALLKIKLCLKNRQILLSACLLLMINLPWAVTFWKVSAVGKFVKTENQNQSNQNINSQSNNSQPGNTENSFRHKNKGLDLANSLKVLREKANSVNPLIIFLSLPGIFLLPKKLRTIFTLQSVILLAGGTLLVSVKPQLELDRLLVFLSVLLCLPVAQALNYLYVNSAKNLFAASFCFGCLLLSPFIVSNILHNRSAENYGFSGKLAENLAHFSKELKTDGRLLFSGFVLHELDGGHVAPLPEWTKKPFIASSPFHNRWKYSSVFPDSFASKGERGINEFLDLYNVEIIFAHEAIWRNYFSSRTDQFEEIYKGRPFVVFRRKNFESDYFLEGDGQILSQDGNHLLLQPESQNSVLKFNYYPFLKSDNCQLSPFDAGLEFPFIRLSNCDLNKKTLINSVSPIGRVLND